MKKLTLLIALLVSVNAISQDSLIDYIFPPNITPNQSQGCESSSQSCVDIYRLQSSYIPDSIPFIGEIKVPINFIILAKSDSTEGAYTPTQFSNEIHKFYWLNYSYTNTALPSDPVPGFNPDYWLDRTKIQCELNQVFFYYNTTWFDAPYLPDQTGVNNLLSYHFTSHPEAASVINCFLLKNGMPTVGGYVSSYNFEGTIVPIVVTSCWNEPVSPFHWTGNYWYWSNHLPHEIGHILGLGHTYQGAGAEDNNGTDYLNDVFFSPTTWETKCNDPDSSATDFCTNNMMSGQDKNDFVSPLQAGRMHRNLRTEFGLWKNAKDYAYGYSSTPHEISNNETWDFVFKSYNDIVVKGGASLTLTCILEMVPQAKIVVEPGGRLIIDGGTVTSARNAGPSHEGLWQGIEVWGNPLQTQDAREPNGLPTYQGEVIIRNGGTISNALMAVAANKVNSLSTYASFDWSKTGGIIIADHAHFINNRSAIWIGGYTNFDPGFPYQVKKQYNRSTIQNCIFEINDDMPDPAVFHSFVKLHSGSGISIRGNAFRNIHTSQQYSARGKGIVAYDFPVYVSDICAQPNVNPCPAYEPNSFTGLHLGIEILGITAGGTVVKNSEFSNCRKGLYLGSTYSAQVLSNTFQIPGGYDDGISPYGMYIDGGSGFTVEGNSFASQNTYLATRGIVVQNTGSLNNEIYKNNFDDLHVGIQAQFINKDASGATYNGLRLFCNTHENPWYDIYVGGKWQYPNLQGVGITQYQESVDTNSNRIPTGNVFSSLNRRYDLDFSNKEAEYVYYTYYGAAMDKQEPAYFSNISLDPVYIGNACPSKALDVQPSLGQLYASRASARAAVNSSTIILNIWRDGGNVNLGDEVATTLPWDVYTQFNELMGTSPYLSDQVLINMIENPAFSPLMVKLLMLANPHGIRSEPVMDALYNRVPPLPEDYIDEILAGEDAPSPLEGLEADVAADYHLYKNLGESIKRTYRGDTLNAWANDSLVAFMEGETDLADRYEMALVYLLLNRPSEKDQIMEDILNNYALSEEQETEYDLFDDLFGIWEQKIGSGLFTDFLDAPQQGSLTAMVEDNRPQLSALALALLRMNDEAFEYEEVIIDPDSTWEAKRVRAKVHEPAADLLRVYPNPASDQLTLVCDLKGQAYVRVWIVMLDAGGREVYSYAWPKASNEMVIDTRNLGPGAYFVRLMGDGKPLRVRKFNIIR